MNLLTSASLESTAPAYQEHSAATSTSEHLAGVVVTKGLWDNRTTGP